MQGETLHVHHEVLFFPIRSGFLRCLFSFAPAASFFNLLVFLSPSLGLCLALALACSVCLSLSLCPVHLSVCLSLSLPLPPSLLQASARFTIYMESACLGYGCLASECPHSPSAPHPLCNAKPCNHTFCQHSALIFPRNAHVMALRDKRLQMSCSCCSAFSAKHFRRQTSRAPHGLGVLPHHSAAKLAGFCAPSQNLAFTDALSGIRC